MNRDYKYRFISKMALPNSKNGCIRYLGAFSHSGYGVFDINEKTHSAHRISYELFVGKIPKGKMVLHKCDNRQCIAPQHLFIGTQADNMKDMHVKNRHHKNKGEKCGHSKLSVTDVKNIKAALKRGMKQKYIALRYKVSPMTVSDIKHKRTWKHIA